MISFDVLIGDKWETAEAHTNLRSDIVPRIGERVNIDNHSHRVIDVEHQGLDSKGGHFIRILAKPDKIIVPYDMRKIL